MNVAVAPPSLLILMLVAIVATEPPAQNVSSMFSQRAERRAAVRDAKAQATVKSGVRWLLDHQDEKGFWDADGFMKRDPEGQKCDGPGNEGYDVGVTAFALLALLAQADDVHKGAMHRAADWLVDRQVKATGKFRPEPHDFIYQQAIGTLALVEASVLLGNERYRLAAVAGLRYLEKHRSVGKAWRYLPLSGESDTSVTTWCVAAYVAAQHAGLEVKAETVGEAIAWLEGVTKPATGHCGYTLRGEDSARMPGDHTTRFPVELTEVLTASGMHMRTLAGILPSDRLNRAAADLLLAKLPRAPAANDFYYWLQGSEAMAPAPTAAGARKWFAAVSEALLGLQREAGAARGSWDPSGPWGESGGRVYSTAAAILALSSEYRLDLGDAEMVVPDRPPFRRAHRHWQVGAIGKTVAALNAIPAAELTGDDVTTMQRARWYVAVQQRYCKQVLQHADTLFAKPVDRYERLQELADRYSDTEVGGQFERAATALFADPVARDEIKAGQLLREIYARFDRSNPPESSSKRSALRKRFEQLVKKYPKSAAAESAGKWVDYFGR